jgi:hypothetical protein
MEDIYNPVNFSYDKEYIKSCDFIMDNSFILPIDFIKYAEQQINRHENIQKIDEIVNCLNISEDIEKGIFEFALNYVKTHGYPDHFFQLTYNDKLHDLLLNLDVNNKRIENKTLLPNILNAKLSGQIIAFLKNYSGNEKIPSYEYILSGFYNKPFNFIDLLDNNEIYW